MMDIKSQGDENVVGRPMAQGRVGRRWEGKDPSRPPAERRRADILLTGRRGRVIAKGSRFRFSGRRTRQ
jgi:hypothetical protein